MKNKVIIIYGTSGSGKSYFAAKLSKKYSIPILQIDDIRIALQTMLDREKHKDLFFFSENLDFQKYLSIEKYVDRLKRVAISMWPAVKTIVEKHLFLEEWIIIEGDSILPSLIDTIKNNQNIYQIFINTNKESLYVNKTNRNRHNETRYLDMEVEFSLAFNSFLQEEVDKYKIETTNNFTD